jgi:hypothetical protein
MEKVLWTSGRSYPFDTNARQRMPPETFQKISNRIINEPWTAGRHIRVNQATNTISTFDLRDPLSAELQQSEIPLFYEGVPIIPHCYAYPEPLPLPSFNFTADVPKEWPSLEIVNELRNLLGSIAYVDYYFDGIVEVFIPFESFAAAVSKVESAYFLAWGLTIVLIMLENRKMIKFVRGEEENEIIPKTLQPGSHIYNDMGEFSTLGVFLHKGKKYISSAQIQIDYFTISAHSFLKKKVIEIGINVYAFLVVLLVTYVAYHIGKLDWSMAIINQYLVTRVGITLIDSLWKYTGVALEIHNMVIILLFYLTSLPGKVVIERSIPLIGLAFMYLVPVILSFVFCYLVECGAPFLKTFKLIGIQWSIVIEILFSYYWTKAMRKGIEGDETFLPAEMMASWMRPIMRNEQGLVHPPWIIC